MSGGEQQRVAIARALVNHPAVLLADEPTGNLDSKSGAEVIDIFKRLNEGGTTLVVITHNREVAIHSKRIFQMLDGRLVGEERLG
jgi:putative ABC transport system ATP-binding protein